MMKNEPKIKLPFPLTFPDTDLSITPASQCSIFAIAP